MSSKKNPEIVIQNCPIGGITPEHLEVVSKLSDVLIANADAVKELAQRIKVQIGTGIHIGTRNE